MTTRPVRALIVEDEPPARERIRSLLEAESEIEVVGDAGSGTEAIRLIRLHRPDLVFLDIQLPGPDGFDVLRAVAPHAPAVIFITAHDAYAIRAFDCAAVDYLLKPIVESRFRAALERALARVRSVEPGLLAEQVAELLRHLPAPPPAHLPIWSDGRVIFLDTDDIDWIDAADDHVRLHVAKTTHLTRESMKRMEARLPPQFLRIHRSVIVNTTRIGEVRPWFKGDYLVTLRDGTRFTSGRTYRERVRALLGRGP